MEIAALAARTPDCLMRHLENGKGSIIASARISAPWLSGRPKDPETRHQLGDFCNTPWFVGPLAKDGLFASYEAFFRFKTTAAAETKTRIPKKEKYNGRLQKSHQRNAVRTA
jgi:hypothetical protein